MRKLFTLAILVSATMSYGQVNWSTLLEEDSARNFAGNLHKIANNDINQCIDVEGEQIQLLGAAIKYKSNNIVNYILDNRNDIDFSNICDNNTILLYAVLHGDTPLVKKVLDNGADPRQESKDGMSPQKMAFMTGKREISALLSTY